MTTSLHPEIPNLENHAPWRVVFADAAARLADAGVYSAADVTNKITALQLDTKEAYYLASIGPTVWTIYGSVGVSLTGSAPANVTKAAAAVGVATDAARADHKHDISTAAPTATGVATASGEGSATTLARSDHTHQSNTSPANVTKAAAAIGTSGQPARADHKHDITTAAAIELTDATNAEGAATSLARSNHTHAHGNRSGGTLHADATDSVAGFMSAAMKLSSNFIRKPRVIPFALMGIPRADFPVTAIAPSGADSTNTGRDVAVFSDSVEQGRTFEEFVPSVATDGRTAVTLRLRLVTKPATAPGAPATAAIKVYYRTVSDAGTFSAWSSVTLADLNFTANVNTHIDDFAITIGAGGGQINVTAGQFVQFEVTRVDPSGGVELAGNLHADALLLGWAV